jgi:hypothetical protein
MAAPTIGSQISAIDDEPSCVLPIKNEGRVVGTLRCEPSCLERGTVPVNVMTSCGRRTAA